MTEVCCFFSGSPTFFESSLFTLNVSLSHPLPPLKFFFQVCNETQELHRFCCHRRRQKAGSFMVSRRSVFQQSNPNPSPLGPAQATCVSPAVSPTCHKARGHQCRNCWANTGTPIGLGSHCNQWGFCDMKDKALWICLTIVLKLV